MTTEIRIGLPRSSGHYVEVAKELGAPVLISANSHWVKPKKMKKPKPEYLGRRKLIRPGYFRPVCDRLDGMDAALDSGGFVAMTRYGGFRFSIRKYVEFAASFPWTHWFQQDYCVEKEVAPDKDELKTRIHHTVMAYWYTLDERDRLLDQGYTLSRPVPVLQGRQLEDYLQSAELHSRLIGGLPPYVGIGSVCRRNSERELLSLVVGLARELPGVRFHLFGVKGAALQLLIDEGPAEAIQSIDSMAWNDAARWATPEGESSTNEFRSQFMRDWYRKHTGQAPPGASSSSRRQLSLSATPTPSEWLDRLRSTVSD